MFYIGREGCSCFKIDVVSFFLFFVDRVVIVCIDFRRGEGDRSFYWVVLENLRLFLFC